MHEGESSEDDQPPAAPAKGKMEAAMTNGTTRHKQVARFQPTDTIPTTLLYSSHVLLTHGIT